MNSPAHPPARSFFSLQALAIAAVAAGVTFYAVRQSPVASAGVSGPPTESQDFVPARPEGELPPWGELKRVRMVTEKPEEFLDPSEAAAEGTDWMFNATDAVSVRTRLESAGVSPAVVAALMQPPVMHIQGDGILLRPADDFVLALSPEDRRRLYKELRRSEAGHFQVYPFCFPSGQLPELLGGRVSPATLGLVTRLLYRVGKADCFADLGPALRAIPDTAERRRLLKALTRQDTLILKAVIRPDTSVDRLLAYWSIPSRRKDIQPLLNSLTSVPGGVLLDTVHLLPAFARQRLYTFPDKVVTGQREYDCHWTSLNFLRAQPDMKFLNSPDVSAALETEYETVPGPTRLGDILLYTTDGMSVVHSCVYIADDVVFTKNGANLMQPWLYMTLSEMEIIYPSDEPYKIITYRLRGR